MAKKQMDRHLAEANEKYPEYTFVEFGEYKPANQTLVKYICKDHGEQWIRLATLKDKKKVWRGCPHCKKDNQLNGFTGFVEAYGPKLHEGYYFVDENFNTDNKVTVRCPTHGLVRTNMGTFSRDSFKFGCKKCADADTMRFNRKSNEKFLAEARDVHGDKYEYLSPYINRKSPILLRCKKHGDFIQVADVHLNGSGCQKCAEIIVGEKGRLPFKEFKERALAVHGNKYNYCEESYTKVSDKLKITCKKHGDFYQTGSGHVAEDGNGCPKCPGANKVSTQELELFEFCKTLAPDAENSFKYKGHRELDIFINSKNLAIEFDGLIWHSTKRRTPAEQRLKSEDAKELGVELIRIFEDEWLFRKKQVKQLLAARLGKLEGSIYARKCKVVELTNEEAKDFHEENHIQGWKRSGKSFGLSHNGNLVAVMTFTNQLSKRVIQEGVIELIRYSTTTQVKGGASKLLAAAIKSIKPKQVISYSDKRLFTGGMYAAIGFEKAYESKPNYSYWKEGTKERKHKALFKRENLPNLLGDKFDPALSEKENCEANGYFQVYDDGKVLWELTV